MNMLTFFSGSTSQDSVSNFHFECLPYEIAKLDLAKLTATHFEFEQEHSTDVWPLFEQFLAS